MSASVIAVTLEVKDVLIASSSAFTYSGGAVYVKLLGEEDSVRVRYVAKGPENSSNTWLLYGAEAGDRLIVK